MKDRRDYEKATEIVSRIIRAWDPYCLIAEGAPSDEFDSEIAKITAKVSSFHDSSDVARAISDVAVAAFGHDERFSPQNCADPAGQIFLELARANLLSAA